MHASKSLAYAGYVSSNLTTHYFVFYGVSSEKARLPLLTRKIAMTMGDGDNVDCGDCHFFLLANKIEFFKLF